MSKKIRLTESQVKTLVASLIDEADINKAKEIMYDIGYHYPVHRLGSPERKIDGALELIRQLYYVLKSISRDKDCKAINTTPEFQEMFGNIEKYIPNLEEMHEKVKTKESSPSTPGRPKYLDQPGKIFEDVTSAVTFRKLAPKSKITFGKHKDLSVEELLRIGKKHYLRWMYYNIEGVSFIDEVLEKIGIIGGENDYSIPKPGTDPEYGKEVEEMMIGKIPFKTRQHYKSKLKARAVSKKIVDAKKFSRGSMAWRNQGHR